MKKIALLYLLTTCFISSKAQMTTTTGMTALQYVQNVLLGGGVTVSNVTYTGYANAIGEFNISGATNLGMTNGLVLTTGTVLENDPTYGIGQGPHGPNDNTGSGANNGQPGDAYLTSLAGASTYNRAILEFDFIPVGDTVKFNYVFGTEEYMEYVSGGYADVFAFVLSGVTTPLPAVNIAQIPGTGQPVTALNVNANTNPQYYVNNENPPGITVQYDGFTVVLEAKHAVICGETYHIRLMIADALDGSVDAGVFIEAGSLTSNQITIATESLNGITDSLVVESCANASIIFNFIRPVDTVEQVYYLSYGGSATSGSDYSISPDSIVLPIGVDTFQLVIDIYDDDATAGIESPENIIVTTSFTNHCGFTISIETEIWIVEPELSVEANDINLICPQTSINIGVTAIGGTPGFLYDWDTGETTSSISVPGNMSGSYIVIVTDSCGLTATDTVDVTLNQPPVPVVNIIQDSLYQCFGALSNLTSSVTGGATPITYDWSTGGTTAAINHSATNDGYIYLNVTDNCGELSNTDSVYIDVSVPLILNADDHSVTCSGDSTILSVLATGGTPPYSYSWNTGGNDSTETVYTFSTTTYSVTVVDGCQTLVENIIVTVPVYNALSSDMIADTLICLGSSSVISTTITGGAGQYSYSWDNNSNGSFSSITNGMGEFSPEIPGYINVTITDFCGESITDSLFINLEFCAITIPNVFSPNGDGINDLFVITNLERLPNSRLIIFNRWGKIVFESDNYQNNWNGGDVTEGTYYYIVTPSDPEQPEQHGHVTILREKN